MGLGWYTVVFYGKQPTTYLWLWSKSFPPVSLLCWFNQLNIVIHRQYFHLQRWYFSPSTCTHSHSMQKLCYTCGQFHTYVSDTIWRGWALSRAHTNYKLSESSTNSHLSYSCYHRSGKRWWASISFVIPVVSFLVILINSFEFIRWRDITGIWFRFCPIFVSCGRRNFSSWTKQTFTAA